MSAEQTPDIADVGEGPYTGKTIAEIVHDYGHVRGDLVEQYARDQLVRLIEGRIAAAVREAEQRADEALALWAAREVREEWGVQKRAYELGSGCRLYGDDREAAEAAAPRVIGSGAYVIRRTVTTAQIKSHWDRADRITEPVSHEAATSGKEASKA